MTTSNHDTSSVESGKGQIEDVFSLTTKALVVEFVGPTGSGKTTNCHEFSALLRQSGLKVYVFSDIKEYFYGLKFYYSFYIILKTLTIYGLNFLHYSLILAYRGIYSLDSIIRYVKLCVFNMALHEFIEYKKVDVVLLDQWIIQGLWSATIFKLASYETLHKMIKRFYFKTDFVLYFDIDAATASERISSRDSTRSRFDKMDPGRRLEETEKYNAYLYQLYENSDCDNKLMFSTTISAAENAASFLDQLKQKVHYQ